MVYYAIKRAANPQAYKERAGIANIFFANVKIWEWNLIYLLKCLAKDLISSIC